MDQLDTNLQKDIRSINYIKSSTNKTQSSIKELTKKVNEAQDVNKTIVKNINDHLKGGWGLLLVTFILFVVVSIVIATVKYDFNNGFSEITQLKKTIVNPEYNAASISTLDNNVQNLSALFSVYVRSFTIMAFTI